MQFYIDRDAMKMLSSPDNYVNTPVVLPFVYVCLSDQNGTFVQAKSFKTLRVEISEIFHNLHAHIEPQRIKIQTHPHV